MEAKVERQRAETGRIRAIVLKARQEGISTFVASRIYHGCTLWAHRRGLVVADKLDRGGEIFAIYERFDSEAPFTPPKASTRRARELAWKTDSRLTVETAKDTDAGRSATLDYVHASEFASWANPEDTLAGLLDAMPADAGEFWIESTAQGVGNAFHEMWEAAVAGESEWVPIFLPWFVDEGYRLPLADAEAAEIAASTDPWERRALDEGIEFEGEFVRLEPEQLAWRRRKIREKGDERVFRQENPSTAEEAFLVSGSPFFDEAALLDLGRRTERPAQRGNFTRAGEGFLLTAGERGYVRIWEEPDPDAHYVIGADTAEGRLAAARDSSLSDPEGERGGRDFCSADVVKVSELVIHPSKPTERLRVPCLRQVAQIHGRMAPEVFAEQVFGAAAMWSCPGPPSQRSRRRLALTGIERNHSSGQTVIRELRERWRHANLYVHRRINTRSGSATSEVGWVTDGQTRMPMLDALAAAVRQGTAGIFSAETMRELRTFTRGDDGRPEAQEGCHDDRVISLAIAHQMARHHSCGPEGPAGAQLTPEVADTPTGM